jgi:hypothetical protein
MIVARPRAVPIPRPRMALGPTRLNLGKSPQPENMMNKKIELHTWVRFATYQGR